MRRSTLAASLLAFMAVIVLAMGLSILAGCSSPTEPRRTTVLFTPADPDTVRWVNAEGTPPASLLLWKHGVANLGSEIHEFVISPVRPYPTCFVRTGLGFRGTIEKDDTIIGTLTAYGDVDSSTTMVGTFALAPVATADTLTGTWNVTVYTPCGSSTTEMPLTLVRQ